MKRKKVLWMLLIVGLLSFSGMSPVLADAANPLGNVSCGGTMSFPAVIPNLVHLCIEFTKFGVPVILIVLGMIDFTKAVVAQKEDDMKKAQSAFIKRVVIGVVIFLLVAVIQWVFALLGNLDNSIFNKGNITQCINCFIHGADSGYCE